MSETKDMKWTEKLMRYRSPMPHIASSDIKTHAPPEDFEHLQNWMKGQTMVTRSDGDSGVYLHDFDRWASFRQREKERENS